MPFVSQRAAIVLSTEMRRELDELSRSRTEARSRVERARMLLAYAEGQTVSAMTLEHYPGMTEAYLGRIRDEAQRRWGLADSLILHRVGPLAPGEPIVLVACWAEHREAAFAACRYLIDELKTRAPFWKQEQTGAGLRWVEQEPR